MPEAAETPSTDSAHIRYQMVEARRLQWDNLVWQVPVLSFTAQAFLFSIALGDGGRGPRIAASILTLVVTVLSMTLMARHRQAELADAHWLEDYERRQGWGRIHGETWRKTRDATPLDAGRMLDRLLPLWPGFRTWIIGLTLFGLAGIYSLLRACWVLPST
jgi:hypothetical protein